MTDRPALEFARRVRGSPSVQATVKVLPGRARISVGSIATPNGRFSEIVTFEEAGALYDALGNYLAHAGGAGVLVDPSESHSDGPPEADAE